MLSPFGRKHGSSSAYRPQSKSVHDVLNLFRDKTVFDVLNTDSYEIVLPEKKGQAVQLSLGNL
jgi:hypothetical protein